MVSSLHERLVALQSTEELKRKADKAAQLKAKLWTQEELDYCDRQGLELALAMGWDAEGKNVAEKYARAAHRLRGQSNI